MRNERTKNLGFITVFCALACLLVAGKMVSGHESNSKELHILQDWQGDYPVAQLHRLLEGEQTKGVGYFDNAQQFIHFWPAFKVEKTVPDIDFRDHFVVFSRNVFFHNRVGIMKVLLRDGVAEILTVETRSAFPIEDKVGIALAVIPRTGVKYIKAGSERIPVTGDAHASDSDPLNTTYIMGEQEIILQNGRSEVAIGPNSATKIRTSISGGVVEGDLDSDGDKDACLFLVHDPGGSGTFYYVAVAENLNGRYRGTNAVYLGDRIEPMYLLVQNGVVIAKYAIRGPHEPMSTEPSVESILYLAFCEGKLKALKPLGMDEQIVEGRVIIGHEVRSFHPCARKTEYWLSGDSPALKEIITRYKKALPCARPYTPLFMVLVGRYAKTPDGFFGSDYAGAFFVTQLVRISLNGNCVGESLGEDIK